MNSKPKSSSSTSFNSVGRNQYGPLIGSIDEGTSSTRFMVFACKTTTVLTYSQLEIPSETPQAGWVQQDPKLIVKSVIQTINNSCNNLIRQDTNPSDIAAIGITNQRETTVMWDSKTGEPLYDAIVWLDMRTSETVDIILEHGRKDQDFLKSMCGLPVTTYFSAVKMRWLIDNVQEVRRAIDERRCMFGTIDSWLIWNLTGGVNGGIHVTDVTNASRTMLMNINTLNWDSNLCDVFGIPIYILPTIRSSSEIYGYMAVSKLKGVPIAGCLGDQQAALVGQTCFQPGQAKCTYGTGCFLLYNTGPSLIQSYHGLLTTVGYQLGEGVTPIYALEGSIAIAGVGIKWLRDNLEIIRNTEETAWMAAEASEDANGEVYFVPAFSGLYAPYWRKDARSVICGITAQTQKNHVVKAAIESIAFQVKDILESMEMDCGYALKKLLVDGGMTANDYLLQVQADYCGIPVVRLSMSETTALGAAMAAGSAKGVEVWNIANVNTGRVTKFYPNISREEKKVKFLRWKMAVARTLNWIGDEDERQRSRSGVIKRLSDYMVGGIEQKAKFYYFPALLHVGVSMLCIILSRLVGGEATCFLSAFYINTMD